MAKINAVNTFEAIAQSYIAKNRRDGLAEATVRKRDWFLRLVKQPLGHRPISEIAPYEILDAVRPCEVEKNDGKAHRAIGSSSGTRSSISWFLPIPRVIVAALWPAGGRSIRAQCRTLRKPANFCAP